jgi:hypothetical protein
MLQITDTILLVRPACFGFNQETAASNSFQTNEPEAVQEMALQEFETVQSMLKSRFHTLVYEDPAQPCKPDAIFPNNWMSTHQDGTLVLYPMMAPNRRLERSTAIIGQLTNDFVVHRVLDLHAYETDNQFLEGTGSMVLDHVNRVAYACLSPRTHPSPFAHFCRELNFTECLFHAFDSNQHAIYHTNVMMHIGKGYALVCLDSIRNKQERSKIEETILRSGLELIEISLSQVNAFAGNLLMLQDTTGQPCILLSETAKAVLSIHQIKALSKYGELLTFAIPTIERIGGGSIRCMIAEIFLQRKST